MLILSLSVCVCVCVCMHTCSVLFSSLWLHRLLPLDKANLTKYTYKQSRVAITGHFWAPRWAAAVAAAKSLQSCPAVCNPIDGSPPGSPVPGILRARTPEWVAISFSNAWKWKVKVKLLSRVGLLATPWTAARQAPLSMGFSRQEH